MPFINDNFCLRNDAAIRLYHDYAKAMPIIDYHCHLIPEQIKEDTKWENLTQVWLYGDHYKWRAMRSNGIAEKYCTGEASDREKFDKWAETVPAALRNPLYHWTHLELKRYFNCDTLLSPKTADEIWETGIARMQEEDFSARGLMQMSNVKLVCTTDDPVDSLASHIAIQNDPTFNIRVLPTWRPDKGMAIESPEAFNSWIDKLSAAADIEIQDFTTYLDALKKRHDFFHANGCRLSDHGINTAYAEEYTDNEISAIFARVRSGAELTLSEQLKFKSAMLYHFGVLDHSRNWTQQFHFGAQRNNNTRFLNLLGPDTGFDSIGDEPIAAPLARLLNRLDKENALAKTILYNLNPRDNELLATMLGNFQDGSIPGKMQFGSGWWFLDQIDGMTRQIESLSQLGLLSRFVGMLTDSRSFLSYTRHEYFRRILCNILGTDMQNGMIPEDYELTGKMIQDICYNNAKDYFEFDI